MKKSILISCFCVFFTQFMFSQLKVANNGNIGIQLGSTIPLSSLSIGGAGDVNTKLSLFCNSWGLCINYANIGLCTLKKIFVRNQVAYSNKFFVF